MPDAITTVLGLNGIPDTVIVPNVELKLPTWTLFPSTNDPNTPKIFIPERILAAIKSVSPATYPLPL
ncbi:hypothetical protein D3C78_1535040 [compost metagenome]